jgi:hypothetical protein
VSSTFDRVGLWASAWALSAAIWWPIQVTFYPDRILGDGGLGGIVFLLMAAVWIAFMVVGVLAFREELDGRRGLVAVLGLGVLAWLVEREILTAAHRTPTAVALAASVLMPFTFIAALMIVTGTGRDRRRGWLILAGLGVALAALRVV